MGVPRSASRCQASRIRQQESGKLNPPAGNGSAKIRQQEPGKLNPPTGDGSAKIRQQELGKQGFPQARDMGDPDIDLI